MKVLYVNAGEPLRIEAKAATKPAIAAERQRRLRDELRLWMDAEEAARALPAKVELRTAVIAPMTPAPAAPAPIATPPAVQVPTKAKVEAAKLDAAWAKIMARTQERYRASLRRR